MKGTFSKLPNFKFEKNYILTKEKIDNFKLKILENRHKFRSPNAEPKEYIRQIFKLLQHKNKIHPK